MSLIQTVGLTQIGKLNQLQFKTKNNSFNLTTLNMNTHFYALLFHQFLTPKPLSPQGFKNSFHPSLFWSYFQHSTKFADRKWIGPWCNFINHQKIVFCKALHILFKNIYLTLSNSSPNLFFYLLNHLYFLLNFFLFLIIFLLVFCF